MSDSFNREYAIFTFNQALYDMADEAMERKYLDEPEKASFATAQTEIITGGIEDMLLDDEVSESDISASHDDLYKGIKKMVFLFTDTPNTGHSVDPLAIGRYYMGIFYEVLNTQETARIINFQAHNYFAMYKTTSEEKLGNTLWRMMTLTDQFWATVTTGVLRYEQDYTES